MTLVAAALRLAHDPAWKPPPGLAAGAYAEVQQPVLHQGDGAGAVAVFGPGRPGDTADVLDLLDLTPPGPGTGAQLLALYSVTPWFGGLGALPADAAAGTWVPPAGVPGLERIEALVRIFARSTPGAVCSGPPAAIPRSRTSR